MERNAIMQIDKSKRSKESEPTIAGNWDDVQTWRFPFAHGAVPSRISRPEEMPCHE